MERNKERICVFFCVCEINTLEKTHVFTTFNANKSVRQIATEMEDLDLLMILSESAIEAQYHFNYLSRYRNRHRSHLQARRDAVPTANA